MEKVTLFISNALAENNFIRSEDVDICRYGIEMFIICILEMCAILFVSIILGNFFETIIYLVGFIPIRIYAGGYHANTRLRCFIMLLAVYAIFSITNTHELLQQYRIYALIISFINILAVYLWAPLENENKSVNANERKYYRKKSLIFSVIGFIIAIIIISVNFCNTYTQAFLLGLSTALLALFAGKIKNIVNRGEKR
ncbi:MAG: accessory gene regulator B family protein [bacterium]|nr:accessory gene regulator B family protein [bacterium]